MDVNMTPGQALEIMAAGAALYASFGFAYSYASKGLCKLERYLAKKDRESGERKLEKEACRFFRD